MNDISFLKDASGASLVHRVEGLRAKIGIAQTTGYLGDKDLEKFNSLLDSIIKEK